MNPVIRQLCDISIASLRGDQYNEPLIDEKALQKTRLTKVNLFFIDL